MITHVGDTSNLILDPDLDSFYTMDMTLVALPQTQDRNAGSSPLAQGFRARHDRRRTSQFAIVRRDAQGTAIGTGLSRT